MEKKKVPNKAHWDTPTMRSQRQQEEPKEETEKKLVKFNWPLDLAA